MKHPYIKTGLSLALIAVVGVIGYRTLIIPNARLGSTTTQSTPVTSQNVSSASLPSQTATDAATFVDSEAVNIHTSYPAPYSNGALVVATLNKLGIHNVRDNPSLTPGATEKSTLSALKADGVRFDFTVGPADTTGARGNALVSMIVGNGYQTNTISVEGPNEWDNTIHGANWAAEDRAAQIALYNSVRANAALNSAIVLGPSLIGAADTADAPSLGDLSGSLNVGNIHSYPTRGAVPEGTVASHIAAEGHVAGSKPIWSTESSYSQCTTCTTGNPPVGVPQSSQAMLMPRIYLADYQAGVKKTFSYELLDQGTDVTNYQDLWGLADMSGALKPSGQAIANMNAVLAPAGSTAPQTTSLSYSIAGNASVQHLLLARHTAGVDHYELVVWQNTAVGTAATPITLNFAQAMNVGKYVTNASATATASFTNVSAVNDSATPAVQIYDIMPAPAVTPSPPPPPSGGGGSTTTTPPSTTTKPSAVAVPAGAHAASTAPEQLTSSTATFYPAASSTPGVAITRAEYYLGTKLLATITTAPFAYTLKTSTILNGVYDFKTVTYYSNGTTKTVSRQITVKNPINLEQFTVAAKHYAWAGVPVFAALALGVDWAVAGNPFAKLYRRFTKKSPTTKSELVASEPNPETPVPHGMPGSVVMPSDRKED